MTSPRNFVQANFIYCSFLQSFASVQSVFCYQRDRLAIYACFTPLKKRKLTFIFMIFFSLVQFLRSFYQSKFISLPRFSLSLGSFTTNPGGPESHMMLDVINFVA